MTIECPKCQSDNTDTAHFCSNCAASLHDLDLQAPYTKTMETPREELTTGSTFADRYQIIEELGKGGMGKVYRVLDKKLNEEVALKLIKPEIASDQKTVERFSNELKVARKMVHKNIARMFDLNEEKGTRYITMEYVRGEDLKRLIRKIGQLSMGQTIPITKQTCEGLAEAHRSGFVHRDLKPQNIMVDEDGNARIMDFGIARSLKGKGITGAGVMIGTPEYMSPEQVEGKEVDQRSDIYSLGIILYEMVTGRVPFEGDTPFTIGVKHKSETPQDPKELNAQIPDDLSRVILKCLAKDKEQRYQSAGEVRSELANIEQGIPTTERVVPKKKPLTSREITVTLGVRRLWIPALVLLGVIAAGLILWQFVLKDGAVLLPSEKQTIAVISFENMTQDKVYDHLRKTIPNLLITSLEQSGYFHVTTWERMHDLLKQTGKEEVEFIDRDLGFELCSLEGIDTIVLGSFAKAGNMFATDVKILDVASKALLKSASSRGEGEGSILKTQIDELSQEIARGIGVSERKIAAAQAKIVDVTTSSIEAYEYYLKGREATVKLFEAEARQHFEKAVVLDPDFALAYLELAATHRALGNTNASNDAIDRAMLLSANASKKERLYIQAWYYFFRESDPDKGAKILEQLIEEFPKEKQAHFWLAVYHDSLGLFDQALAGYNKALELDPNYTDVNNMMAYTYLRMRNHDKALEFFEKYASLLPDDPNPLDSIAELYLHMGRLDDAIAKYKETLEIKPDFGSQLPLAYIFALKEDYTEAIKWIEDFIENAPSQGMMADGNIWKGFYLYWLGRLDHSLEFIQRGMTLADSTGNVSQKLMVNRFLGWVYYDQGLLDLSRQHIDIWKELYQKTYPLLEADNSALYNFLLGLIALKQDRIDEAQSRFKEIESLLPDVRAGTFKETVDFNYLGAEVQLVAGSLEAAIKICEKPTSLRLPPFSGRLDGISYNLPFLRDAKAKVYQKRGDLDKAIDEYEQLIMFDPESKERRLIHPKYHYRLAVLYEQKGWPGKAIEQYQRFLELWKEADPGIVEVGDAKKRLAGLQ